MTTFSYIKDVMQETFFRIKMSLSCCYKKYFSNNTNKTLNCVFFFIPNWNVAKENYSDAYSKTINNNHSIDKS